MPLESDSSWLVSRDRTKPSGYKISSIDFANGSPVAAPDSTTSTTDIMINPDNSKCPENCFRPVGLALDKKERLFMSSDSTGEIYVLVKTGVTSPPSTDTAPAASPSESKPSQAQHSCKSSITFSLVAVIVCIMILLWFYVFELWRLELGDWREFIIAACCA